MTYQEALDYIHSVSWVFCKPGLERIRTLCSLLGDPQKQLRFLHVAGTNGKGSFCAMTESVLRHAGYRTGLYTSPYIRRFNERMQVNGMPISDDELAELTAYVKPFADSMVDKPTEFELITAVALEYFRRKGCEIVVFEVGLGGALDSTNIIEQAELSVITGIGLDHTAFLGNTVSEIAAQKAGIIKPHCPVLYGGEDEEAYTVIATHAAMKEAALYRTEHASLRLLRSDVYGSCFDYKAYESLEIALAGLYQPKNAANVIEAVEILRRQGWRISNEDLKEGLREARWHGRFEVIAQDPLTLYDGAHNPQGIAAATESIRRYFPHSPVCLLSGVMRDKDYTDIARMLASVASFACTVTPDNPRSLPAEEYAAVLQQAGIEAEAAESVASGLQRAREEAAKRGQPLICLGSLYLYAELMDVLENE